MARKLSVSVDHNLCVGNQMCISIATKALTLNDDRQAIPADVDADTEEVIIEAAEQCPMAAISVMDADTGEQLFRRRHGNMGPYALLYWRKGGRFL